MMNKSIFFLLIFNLLSAFLYSQDKHFSQFYSTPLAVNPALSGMMEGKYRIGLAYRDQGRSILDNPFRTFAAAFDLRFELPSRNQYKDVAGAGLLFYTDRMAGFDFNTTYIGVSGAYHKTLNLENTQYLSLGLQAGIMQKSVVYDNLYFQDQFNGRDGYTLPTAENLPENTVAFPDFNVGLNYTFAPSKKFGMQIGGAMHHFLPPKVGFFPESRGGDIKMYSLYAAHVAFTIPVKPTFSLWPRAYVALQGPHSEFNGGLNFKFNITERTALILGPWARMVKNNASDGKSYAAYDAIAFAGLDFNKLTFGISYDSNLNAFSNKFGRVEFTLVYIGNYENEDDFCPSF